MSDDITDVTIKNIGEMCEHLEQGLKDYKPLQEWLEPIKEGTKYTDPWFARVVDPVHISYKRKTLEVGFSIMTKNGETRVIVEIEFRVWKDGINPIMIAAIADKAVALCTFCWNNHVMEIMGAYPTITINVTL